MRTYRTRLEVWGCVQGRAGEIVVLHLVGVDLDDAVRALSGGLSIACDTQRDAWPAGHRNRRPLGWFRSYRQWRIHAAQSLGFRHVCERDLSADIEYPHTGADGVPVWRCCTAAATCMHRAAARQGLDCYHPAGCLPSHERRHDTTRIPVIDLTDGRVLTVCGRHAPWFRDPRRFC
jgi:hypothetical protein